MLGRIFICTALLLVCASGAWAANCAVTNGSGTWSTRTWSCGTPVAGDTMFIGTTTGCAAGVTVTMNTNPIHDRLTVCTGSVLGSDNGVGRTLTIRGGAGTDLTNNGTITFDTANPATIAITANAAFGGTGTWNLGAINVANRTLSFANAMTLNLSAPTPISVTTGGVTDPTPTLITWNFDGTAQQTLPSSLAVGYGRITINNATGVLLGANLGLANLSDNLVVQTGILNDNSRTITVQAAKTFQIAAGATFQTMLASYTKSATGTVDYGTTGACGTFEYAGTVGQAIATSANYGNLKLSSTGAKTIAAGMTVACNFTMSSGTPFTAGAFTHNVGGNFINDSASFTSTSSTFNLNGSAVQTIQGTQNTTFNNLTVANSAGVTISNDTTVAGTTAGALTLTNSVITTGSRTLITTGNCNTANLITRNTTGHINGNLQLRFPTGAQACTFHVGDSAAANYTPVAVSFTNVSVAGGLIGKATAGDYPPDANIPINPVANVSRYWTLGLPGSGALSFTGSYDTTYTYLAADNDDAAFAANYVVAKGDSCAPNCSWVLPTTSATPSSTTATATGLTTSFGFLVVGRRVHAGNSTVVASPTVVPSNGTSTSTITVTLKDPAGNVISGRTVSLSAGGGSSTITTLSGTSDVNGQATFSVKDSTVESVTYTAASEGVTITQTATVEFAPTSFNAFESSTIPALTAVTGQLYTKKISTGFTIDVVAVNNAGTRASTFGGSVRVDLVNGQSGGACSSVPAGISATQDLALSSSGRGTTAALTPSTATAYKDVRVRISYPAGSPVVTTCSLDNFAIRPLNFTVTSTDATNTGTSGTPAIKTGANFNLTATAAPGYDGTPSLDNTLVAGSPTAGTLSGSFGAALIGTGVATGSSFTYSEVGNFGLGANAVIDTGFTAVDQPNDCTNDFSTSLDGNGKYGCKIGSVVVPPLGGPSGFGRFIPDHFALTAAGTVAQACSSGGFTYLGQSASFSNVKIEARNSANAKTQNYAGSYVKLDPVTGNFGFAGRDSGGVGTNFASARITATTSGTWTAGELTLSVGTLTIGRLANPDGPYDATKIAIAPADTDSVVMQTGDFNVDTDAVPGNDHAQIGTDTKWRFGRLRLLGGAGPVNRALPLNIRTEHWGGSGFITNTLDGCTALPNANFTLGNYTGALAAGNTSVAPATINFALGVGKLQLTAPSPANRGSVVITADLPGATATYLQGAWNGVGTYDQNPSARAAFGVYGAQPNTIIFMRENH